MDSYGPLFEQLYRGKCGSAVTGAIEYLIYAQADSAPTFDKISRQRFQATSY